MRAPASTAQAAHLPPPVGGLNTIDPGYALPDLDCPLLYNMIAAENGLRSRLGYKEWATGLAGIADNTVRSVLPFAGSQTSNDRLFACTSKGIYEVTASSSTPTLLVTFGVQTGDAGFGISTVVVNSAGGHFLLYCDEENGYYVYTEATNSWAKVVQAASAAWQAAHAYVIGDYVSNGGLTYIATANGNSAAAPATGPSGTGTGIADGTVTWDYAPSVNGVDPATFVFCLVWKNRVWFVQKNTGKAWYLEPAFGAGGAIYGTATALNFGGQFQHGGALIGLYSWTMDGGAGPDDRLVAISAGGDIVIYAGTNPGSANTFGIAGRWYLGGVPHGRRIATDYGGDLLMLSATGIVPLSQLVLGRQPDSQSYTTYKISNLFNRLVALYRGLNGWALRIHPEDNSLIVSVPVAEGQNTVQLAMNLTSKSWSQYRGLPLLSMEAWGGKLYFGTADGRVCINTDYLDAVNLAADSYTPIDCSGITRFSNLGRGSQKQVTMIRPTIISEGGAVQSTIQARYRYDLTEASNPSSSTSPGDSLWDSALWDVSRWGGAFATQQQAGGAYGMGPDVAVAFRLSTTSRTVLVGFDLEFIEGGML